MPHQPLPPGFDDDKVTWNPKGWYEHDEDGRLIKPHPEDRGHWDHWDIIQPATPGKRHRQSTYPEKSRKPEQNRKRRPRSDLSPMDPWPASFHTFKWNVR